MAVERTNVLSNGHTQVELTDEELEEPEALQQAAEVLGFTTPIVYPYSDVKRIIAEADSADVEV